MRVWSPGGETTATPGSDGTFVLDVVQLPEVSVVATDDFSSESGPDTATLTFTRTESTTAPLKVNNSVAYSFPNPSGFTRGNTMIGHNDQADSVGSTNNFVIFDNVRVVTSDARVSSVQLLPGNQVQIDFTSPGSEAEFHLEGSANLSTGIWNEVAGAVISTTPQGFRFVAPASGDVQFYRIRRQANRPSPNNHHHPHAARLHAGFSFSSTLQFRLALNGTPKLSFAERMKEKAATESRYVLRWQDDTTPARVKDELAVEEPLEIQVDTQSVVVTMRTPGHDHELAAGFLLSEGLIKSPREILKIVPYIRNLSGNVLDVFLAAGVTVDFSQLTRHVFASSSCGLCGKASIESVHRHFKRVKSSVKIPVNRIASLPEELRKGQSAFDSTGGLHAAGLFTASGKLLVLREDVGRHNAVDKVLGYALLNDLLPLDKHVLVVSGRASFEIMQKALAARLPIVAAVSAPSSLAVQFAVESGQTLLGFVRGDRLNIYSHPERIKMPTRSVRNSSRFESKTD